MEDLLPPAAENFFSQATNPFEDISTDKKDEAPTDFADQFGGLSLGSETKQE